MSYADVQQSSLPYNNGHAQHGNLSQKGDSPPDDPNENGSGEQKIAKHRRNYQACEPCRERKVKCDLGDVDNPTAGPCKKCAREKKHCWFKPQRKKESTSKEPERPTKRARVDSTDSNTASSTLSRNPPNIPNAPNLPNVQNFQYGPPPLSPARSFYSAGSPPTPLIAQHHPTSNPYSNRTTPPQFVRPQTTPFAPHQSNMSQTYGDNNLSRAQDDHVVIPQANSLAESFTSTTDNMSVLVRAATSTEASANSDAMQQRNRAFTSGSRDGRVPMTSRAQEVRNEAIKVWSEMRFVRAGWFTAEEALEYVEYFYDHLAHMTPVIIHDFRDPATHRTLLAEEPVLALAILAITSRYHILQTPAGVSRGYYVHEKLWDALRRIVQRLLWGQEQFGGGFCGAGMAPTQESVTGQITWKGSLRTLGTIEALLLLTDWQPRALHFPPGDDENKLVGASFALLDEGPAQTQESGNLPYSTWLEPAWRSDRMSWMLLGLAQSLSFELGVFDTRHETCGGKHEPNSDCLKRRRLRRLVIAYVSQISGRMGTQSSLSPEQDTQDHLGPDSNTSKDKMMKLWFEIASIMFDANMDIFPSRYRNAELVESGEYKAAIAKIVPRLRAWFKVYEATHQELSPHMQHVLRMEYEYARLYINSLGLQKVVGQMAVQNRKTSTRGPSKELASVMHDNQYYIDEVRDAAEQILKSSAYGLGNMKALGHAPVRTFLRSLSGMMFVLKLFSLGAEEKVVRAEFKLLRDMTFRMSEQIVDDVHLSPHAARLIQHIMDDVQRKMIRIPKPVSRGQSRQMSPQQHPGQQSHTANNEYDAFDQQSPDLLGSIPVVDLNTQTFMPPPNFDISNTFDAAMNPFDTSMDPALYGANDDWISLPIDNLFNLDSSTVSQGYGGIGPTLGDRDMLSLITGTHLDQNLSGAGVSQNFGGGFGGGF